MLDENINYVACGVIDRLAPTYVDAEGLDGVALSFICPHPLFDNNQRFCFVTFVVSRETLAVPDTRVFIREILGYSNDSDDIFKYLRESGVQHVYLLNPQYCLDVASAHLYMYEHDPNRSPKTMYVYAGEEVIGTDVFTQKYLNTYAITLVKPDVLRNMSVIRQNLVTYCDRPKWVKYKLCGTDAQGYRKYVYDDTTFYVSPKACAL